MVIIKKNKKKNKIGSRVIISIRPGRFLVAHGDQLLAILSPGNVWNKSKMERFHL